MKNLKDCLLSPEEIAECQNFDEPDCSSDGYERNIAEKQLYSKKLEKFIDQKVKKAVLAERKMFKEGGQDVKNK